MRFVFSPCMWRPGLKKILFPDEYLSISVTSQETTGYRCARVFLYSKFNSIFLYAYSHTSTIILITVLQLIHLKI